MPNTLPIHPPDASADPAEELRGQPAARRPTALAAPLEPLTVGREQGAALSAGQQQRIALARALYGDPFLVVLDEPNSNLDAEGEEALTRAILGVRARGGIAIVVAHRPSVLAAVDHLLAMARGGQPAFGPKDEIFASLTSA